jgi:hypothetical protein
MATYKQIAEYVRTKNGFNPKTCWIAHVLSDQGLTKRRAANRIDPKARAYPCPPQKRDAIGSALKHFAMI